jgi:hypothetical protein
MDFAIPDEHTDLLREILDAALRDLRAEIAHTDNAEFKRSLRDREETIRTLLAPLGGPLTG